MSVTLKAIAIDLARYRAVQGSADLKLLDSITEESASEIAAHNAWFAEVATSSLPIEHALRDIVVGTIQKTRNAEVAYSIAAILIAECVGERIDNEEMLELSPSFQPAVDQLLAQILRARGYIFGDWPLLATILTRGPALDIPWKSDYLPNGTGYLSTDEVSRIADVATRLSWDDLEPSDALDLLLILRGWIECAAAKSAALLFDCG